MTEATKACLPKCLCVCKWELEAGVHRVPTGHGFEAESHAPGCPNAAPEAEKAECECEHQWGAAYIPDGPEICVKCEILRPNAPKESREVVSEPGLAHMTTSDLATMLMELSTSQYPSDVAFAKTVREEIKRRKPDYDPRAQPFTPAPAVEKAGEEIDWVGAEQAAYSFAGFEETPNLAMPRTVENLARAYLTLRADQQDWRKGLRAELDALRKERAK